MLVRASIQLGVVRIFRTLILPSLHGWRRLARAAEILDQWGKRSGCHIDWRAMCVGSSEMHFEPEVLIERDALLVTVEGGRIFLGHQVWIGEGVSLRAAGGILKIGKRSFVGVRSLIGAGAGGVRLGEGVLLGPYVTMIVEQHRFDAPDQFIVDQGVASRGIVVEDDVWIGAHACILDGVVIGKGSVIGAGSVVTKSVPPYTVMVGVPAKPLRHRGSNKNPQLSPVL